MFYLSSFGKSKLVKRVLEKNIEEGYTEEFGSVKTVLVRLLIFSFLLILLFPGTQSKTTIIVA